MLKIFSYQKNIYTHVPNRTPPLKVRGGEVSKFRGGLILFFKGVMG